jgi:hypothetical protein
MWYNIVIKQAVVSYEVIMIEIDVSNLTKAYGVDVIGGEDEVFP